MVNLCNNYYTVDPKDSKTSDETETDDKPDNDDTDKAVQPSEIEKEKDALGENKKPYEL